MTIPDYQSLMLPVLRLAAESETRVPDVAARVAAQLGLEPEERDRLLASGRQTVLHNRIHWAKFYMGKAGLIDSPRRGRFVASAAGRALLAENPERIDVERLLAIPAFRTFYRSGPAPADSPSDEVPVRASAPEATPEDQIEAAILTQQGALRADLLGRIGENRRTAPPSSKASSSICWWPWVTAATGAMPRKGSAGRGTAASTV